MEKRKELPPIHYLDQNIARSVDPIRINLVGAGGTGSHVLTSLADMNAALRGLGLPGFKVNVFDEDTVSRNNLGRQRFSQSEIGLPKSATLVNRVNRFYGLDWRAHTFPFAYLYKQDLTKYLKAQFTITCVDTVRSRLDIEKMLLEEARVTRPYQYASKATYWLDFGNSRYSGQVFLSTLTEVAQPSSKKFHPVSELPLFTHEYKATLKSVKDTDQPSCSMHESLARQDLFVNPTLAIVGCRLFWNLLEEGMTTYRGVFVNVKDFKVVPVPIAIPAKAGQSIKRAA